MEPFWRKWVAGGGLWGDTGVLFSLSFFCAGAMWPTVFLFIPQCLPCLLPSLPFHDELCPLDLQTKTNYFPLGFLLLGHSITVMGENLIPCSVLVCVEWSHSVSPDLGHCHEITVMFCGYSWKMNIHEACPGHRAACGENDSHLLQEVTVSLTTRESLPVRKRSCVYLP